MDKVELNGLGPLVYDDGVFIYSRDETGWSLQQNVNLPEELSGGRLSLYADVSSDLLAVTGTNATDEPLVYFFTRSNNTWTYSNLITLPESTRVQIDGNTALFTNYIVELDNLPQTPEIAVQGNGADIFDGATVPNPETDTDFGRVNVNSGIVEKTFTIQNSAFASVDLTLSDVSISGDHADDFTVTADPTSPVAPDSETAFTVTFDPSAPGVRTAQVNIANNDSDENPFTFVVQGVGATLDVNLDGTITAADAIFVINRLGNPATGDDAIADVDGDSEIDSDDVNAVVGALGQPTP